MGDTDDKEKDTSKQMSEMINSAVTEHFKRKMPAMIGEAVKTSIADLKIGEQIAAELAKLPQVNQQQGSGQSGQSGQSNQQQSGGQQQSQVDAATAARLASLEKQLADATKAAASEREAARNEKRDAQLESLLGKINVDPHRRRGAAAVLRDGCVWDEGTSTWTYKARRDGYDETVPLETFVMKEWAVTDEGKSYISAQQRPGGSGTRPTQGQQQGGGQRQVSTDPKAARAQAVQDARASLMEAVGNVVGGSSISIGAPLGPSNS